MQWCFSSSSIQCACRGGINGGSLLVCHRCRILPMATQASALYSFTLAPDSLLPHELQDSLSIKSFLTLSSAARRKAMASGGADDAPELVIADS